MSSGAANTQTFEPTRKSAGPRQKVVLITYLTFVRVMPEFSEAARVHAEESTSRLVKLLRYLKAQYPVVSNVSIQKHVQGGLITVGRGHPVTQVMVELDGLTSIEAMRRDAAAPGPLRDLIESVRERVDTCSSEVVRRADEAIAD